MRKYFTITLAGIFCLMLAACSDNIPVPKPQAYIRVELPKKSYQSFDSATYPYSFNYPAYAQLEYLSPKTLGGEYFLNMDFPSLNGIIYFSYKKMNNKEDFAYNMDTCSRFIELHYQKSSGVTEKSYIDNENKVYASVFHIKGIGVATPYQFWITDSVSNFFRGALYFKETPNTERMAPAIDFIGKDIDYLINSFRWKKIGTPKTTR